MLEGLISFLKQLIGVNDRKIEITPEFLEQERSRQGLETYTKWLRKIIAEVAAHIELFKQRGRSVPEEFLNALRVAENEWENLINEGVVPKPTNESWRITDKTADQDEPNQSL